MSLTIHNIVCKQCHAPLSLLANPARSKTLTCQYCGIVMDSQHDFKALYSFTQIQQNRTALRIGMQGKIQHVDFIISGLISYKSRETEWIQFQLYSPTHGYAQLIKKQKDYIFLRKTYYLPNHNLWMLKQGDNFVSQGETFTINRFYFAEIVYAAGDLTLNVKQGKRNKQCFAQADDHWFISSQRRDVVTYYSGYSIKEKSLESQFISSLR